MLSDKIRVDEANRGLFATEAIGLSELVMSVDPHHLLGMDAAFLVRLKFCIIQNLLYH